ncbi:hypothetical protein E2C01_024963 [Portunus trituberculatus]|uniref:Uncharacterized protein n=1 Tax=Portunus trituberculatus TaxID=210409 RepID=A0A5B7EDU8_PORTR|nr:hypothetical protein [Portunus trituberculatus]
MSTLRRHYQARVAHLLVKRSRFIVIRGDKNGLVNLSKLQNMSIFGALISRRLHGKAGGGRLDEAIGDEEV